MPAAGSISELFAWLATLMLMAGGFCLVFQQKRWARRLLIGGVALAVGASFIPNVLAGASGLSWQGVLVLVAVVAAIFRQWWIAVLCVAPLVLTGMGQTVGGLMALIAIAVALLLLSVGTFVRILDGFWGKETTGHVVGTYVVRTIDSAFERKPRGRSRLAQHTDIRNDLDSELRPDQRPEQRRTE